MAERLAERVREGRGGPPQNGGTVATPEPAKALVAAVRAMEPEYAVAIGSIRGATADQLVRDATTLIRRTPELADCAQVTVLGGLMNFAQLGLRVATPLGHGWLIPMWNAANKRMEATTVIGYKGYTKLAYNSGVLRDVRARTIHVADEWSVEYGTHEEIVHRPQYNPVLGGRGRPVGYYCVVNTSRGGQVFHFRSQEEMEDHRDRYAMARKYDWVGQGRTRRKIPRLHPDGHPDAGRPVIVGPWRDNFEPMAHKTEWLSCAKYVPMSADLELAVAGDSTVRMDLNPRNRDAIIGDRPDDVTVWDVDLAEEVAEPAERETVTVHGRGEPRAEEPPGPESGQTPGPAATTPAPVQERGAEPQGDTPGGDAPPSASPDDGRQVAIRQFFATMRECGITGDEACLVLAAALAGVTPVPGSFNDFTDEQLLAILGKLRDWRTEGKAERDRKVLEARPAEDSPVWAQVAAARAEHEAAKAPSARRRAKKAEQ